jgi:CHAT domain-containing protein/Tfp pilus assembly protein PilF
VPASPEAALSQGREVAKSGNPHRGADIIEEAIARVGSRLSKPDAVVLHLEAASLASEANESERAHFHLGQVSQLSGSYRAVPRLHANLLRKQAQIYRRLGDLPNAEPLLAAAADELASIDLLAAADASNQLGELRLEMLRPDRAVSAFRQSLGLFSRARASPDRLVPVLANLGMAQLQAGKLSDAKVTHQRAVAAAHGDVALTRGVDLLTAQLLLQEPDLTAAEEILTTIAAGDANEHDPVRGHALLLLATSRFNRGLAPESAEAALAAADVYRAVLGEWDPALGRAFHMLGTVYEEFGDRPRAEDFFGRAASIQERAFGEDSIQFQTTQIERGWLSLQDGNVEAAERRAHTALNVLGNTPAMDQRRVGLAHILLGLAAEASERRDEAVRNYLEGQRLIALSDGARSPDLTFSLVRLGRLLTRMGRYNEAREKLDRAIALLEDLGSSGTIRLAEALNARADLRAAQRQRLAELEDSRRIYELLLELVIDGGGTDAAFGQPQQHSARELFGIHALRLLSSDGAGDPAVLQEAFAASQYSLSSRTGDALRRAMLRRSLENDDLAKLLREREEVADALRQANALLSQALSDEQSNSGDAAAGLRRLGQEKTEQLRALDRMIATRFPRYDEFAHPRPISLAAVQAALAPDEAILMTVLTENKLLLWAIDRMSAAPVEVAIGAPQIKALVDNVRDSIYLALRHSGSDPLPAFDYESARQLWQAIILPASLVLNDKNHIIFLPEGALQSIRLHILSKGEGQPWLASRYAVTTEPSLSAFVAARQSQQRSRAARDFLGVGVTKFAGFGELPTSGSGGVVGELRDVLASLQPLRQAASELQRMSADFSQAQVTVLVDRVATRGGFLASSPGDYKMIAFATHALTVKETPGLSEPAIVLFPNGGSARDNLLTPSDIAALNLDADLVILSACNTAAPEAGPYLEGLSGLARAFIIAGSRSMLVSHWSVPDQAAPILTTSFLAAIRKDQSRRKADALRSAMLELLATRDPKLSHPAYWAPFVVVGE